MKRTLVAVLVLMALVGFGFQTQTFAGSCTKTLCWGLWLNGQPEPVLSNAENHVKPDAVIKANVDCNLKALKTKAFVATGSFEFYVPDTTVGYYTVAPLVGTLQKIPVSVNGDLVTVNSSPVKKPVMSLVGSAVGNGNATDGFLHMIFYDYNLERGRVFGEFEIGGLNEFQAEFYRISCKYCPSNNFNDPE